MRTRELPWPIDNYSTQKKDILRISRLHTRKKTSVGTASMKTTGFWFSQKGIIGIE